MKKIILVIFTLVSLSAFAQTNGDIVDRLNATLGVRLPAEYEAKVKEFAANDTIMRTRSATAFTEQFIIEQFKNDWGIDRQNQLLFMWSKIYGGISQKKLYNWLDDDNKERSSEYKKCLKNISEFYEGYKKGFKEYMEQKSAEYDRRSAEAKRQSAEADRRIAEADRRIAEADRRIAEADRRIAEADGRIAEADGRIAEANDKAIKSLNNALTAIISFYDSYNILPDPKRLESFKPKVIKAISLCKHYKIDYKAKLRKELGDDKKVQELLKFYGVE